MIQNESEWIQISKKQQQQQQHKETRWLCVSSCRGQGDSHCAEQTPE